MAVKIRLMRIGTNRKPFYRVVAVDERKKRTGGYLELLGTYNPLTEPKQVNLLQDKIDAWIKKGAVPSYGFLRIIGKAPQRAPRKAKKERKEEAKVSSVPQTETQTPVETEVEQAAENSNPEQSENSTPIKSGSENQGAQNVSGSEISENSDKSDKTEDMSPSEPSDKETKPEEAQE